jgi:hypothetical protein
MYELTQNEVKRKMIATSARNDVQSHLHVVRAKKVSRDDAAWLTALADIACAAAR